MKIEDNEVENEDGKISSDIDNKQNVRVKKIRKKNKKYIKKIKQN